MRFLVAVLLSALALSGCTRPSTDVEPARRADTLSRFDDGTPKRVTIFRGDSVLERRTYRPTGRLERVVTGDSVRSYLDLHDPDSAAVLQDYLQGRWQNLSADTSRPQASRFYVFTPDRLTFENPSRTPLESLSVTYEDNRTLRTGSGMSVRADITSFDTVRVTGYTLVRTAPSADSAQ